MSAEEKELKMASDLETSDDSQNGILYADDKNCKLIYMYTYNVYLYTNDQYTINKNKCTIYASCKYAATYFRI